MRLKTIKLLATMAIIAVLLLPGIALAYIYEAPLSVANSGAVSYDMLPVLTTSSNQWLVDNGFIRADARDTSVETLSGSVKPRMITEDKTLTAIPVPANSQTNLKFKTGQSNTNMDIIVGHDGYISVAEAAALEPGSDFVFEIDGYVDTSSGSSKRLVNKQDSAVGGIEVYVSAASEISAALRELAFDTPTGDVDPDAGWNNEGLAYDDDTLTKADSDAVAAAAWSKFLELTQAAALCKGIRYYASNGAFDEIDIDLYYDGGWQDLYQGVRVSGAWTTKAMEEIETVTAMRIRAKSAAPGQVFWLHEVDFINDIGPAVVATGLPSDEYVVVTEGDALLWAPGDALSFDTTATSRIDLGALYNAAPKLWVSFWFKLNNDFVGGGNSQFLWCKLLDGNDFLYFFISSGDNKVHFMKNDTLLTFNIASAETSWVAGTWYHVLGSISAVNGARLRINNGAVITDADVSAVCNGGNIYIGESGYPALGTDGVIANVAIGTDDLIVGEEADLYANVFPADTVNLYYIDEGTGATITDYGTGGNNGTKGANTTWGTSIRPCKFIISIDGTAEDGFARPVSVPDNANDWIINQNNVLPYMASYKQSVGGVLLVHYEPNTLIIGTALPDREGAAQDGVITWGANPANVTVTLGSLVSAGQPDIGAIPETASRDVLPETEVSDWYVQPDVTGTLLTNPIRPFVTMISDNTTLTELQTWRWLGIAFVLLITGACIRAVRRHLVISCIGAGVATVVMVVLTIFPQWALVFLVLYALGGWVSERSPSL